MAKQGKERIIAAAFQLFLKKGYQSVSLKDIITESQLSKGAIYHHFDSKYAIYLAALEEYFFKILQNTSNQDEGLDFRQQIQLRYRRAVQLFAFVEGHGATGNSFPIRTYFIFQLESERDDAIRENVQKAIKIYRQEIIDAVQKAKTEGLIKLTLTSETIAFQIISMIEGLAIHHSALERGSEVFLLKKYEEIIDSYLDIIIGFSFKTENRP